jgi:hypothetical protein
VVARPLLQHLVVVPQPAARLLLRRRLRRRKRVRFDHLP